MTSALDPLITDDAILDRIARGDQTALDAFYQRHGRTAFGLAYRVLGDPEAAEEAVQDSFLTIWRRAERFDPARGAARAWLLTVVRNRAIDLLRARESRPKTGASIEDARDLQATDADPADSALRRATAETVRAALASLSTEQREVVELAFFGGFSYPEVAERTKAPLGTVKSRMRLAMERLRGALLAGGGVE